MAYCGKCNGEHVKGHASGLTRIDLGNNEASSIGVVKTADGAFLALTLSQSKTFRTRKGAVDWLARRGYSPTGRRL